MSVNFSTLISKSTQSGTPEEIAYHLMLLIASDEIEPNRNKEYWLSLYEECLKASKGITR